jgi:hypothetical protein
MVCPLRRVGEGIMEGFSVYPLVATIRRDETPFIYDIIYYHLTMLICVYAGRTAVHVRYTLVRPLPTSAASSR